MTGAGRERRAPWAGSTHRRGGALDGLIHGGPIRHAARRLCRAGPTALPQGVRPVRRHAGRHWLVRDLLGAWGGPRDRATADARGAPFTGRIYFVAAHRR